MINPDNIPREQCEEVLKSAQKALDDYQKDVMDCNAGYQILRYAKAGLYEVKKMTILEQLLIENGFASKSDRDKLLENKESLDNVYLRKYEDWGDTYTECPF